MTARRKRPTYPGFLGADYELIDFNPDAEAVEPMRRPAPVPPPDLVIPPEIAQELRHGLGRVDMDIRWMFWLDDRLVLRFWRSWTGYEIYRATLTPAGEDLRISHLDVESDPERYGGDPAEEADTFLRIYRFQLELLGLRG